MDLSQFVTPKRLSRMDEVLQARTRQLCVVLEDIYQGHNASAVLRSCDAFGVQDVHIIENYNPWRVSRDIALGSDQWLTLHRYRANPLKPYPNTNEGEREATLPALKKLKDQGYTLVATSLEEPCLSLEDLARSPKLDQSLALMFGAEKWGLSRRALEMADLHVKLPMRGFSQSFNVSVCAALCLYRLTEEMRRRNPKLGLNPEERELIREQWVRNSLPHGLKTKLTSTPQVQTAQRP